MWRFGFGKSGSDKKQITRRFGGLSVSI